jgi:hypothetical protein
LFSKELCKINEVKVSEDELEQSTEGETQTEADLFKELIFTVDTDFPEIFDEKWA